MNIRIFLQGILIKLQQETESLVLLRIRLVTVGVSADFVNVSCQHTEFLEIEGCNLYLCFLTFLDEADILVFCPYFKLQLYSVWNDDHEWLCISYYTAFSMNCEIIYGTAAWSYYGRKTLIFVSLL